MYWLFYLSPFTIISLAYGMPALLPGKISKIPLHQAKHRLKSPSTPHGKTHFQHVKYSPFVMELYQTLILGNETDLSSLEHSVLQETDTILSLTAKSCFKVENRRAVFFDMSSISRNTEIRLAELRIYLHSSEKNQDVILDIYDSKEGQEGKLIGSSHIDSSTTSGSSWKVFNLTQMLQNSQNQQKRYSKRIGHQENSCQDVSTDRAVLVIFSKDLPSSKPSGYPNLIDTVKSSKYVKTPEETSESGVRKQRKNRNAKPGMIMNNFPTHHTEDGRPLCRRVDMIVDFEKIGWGDLVIYPKKVNSYRCEGACPIPLTEVFKPTNHAYIKSLVKLYDSDRVECASCVPVKMRPLSMLMYEEGDVVMKHHEDMIVEECGCH
ncbi:nodal homolog 2-A-like [Hyla sarda]|uniref:nodal homolog 2-A-like n=1 Tax=Hyla sarda TaxID=327740 RepID=UPI0024C22C75|nr:nodal homolog 2-A-like [Hyla sarda]